MAADRAEALHVELATLLARHESTLTEAERADLVRQRATDGGPDRPARPEPKIAEFLNLSDRAEQEDLTYGTLAAGTVDELRNAFRRGLEADRSELQG